VKTTREKGSEKICQLQGERFLLYVIISISSKYLCFFSGKRSRQEYVIAHEGMKDVNAKS
jgi:hypothetical protein